MAITYRLMTIDDYNEVYDIWVACHNGLNSTDDSKEGIEKYLKRNPTTSFVAVDDGHVAGVILCGHDGRSACFYHVCVAEAFRRQGIGQAMDHLDFGKMIDRSWPDMDDPAPRPGSFDEGTVGFLKEVYREAERRGIKVEKFRLEKGSDQIRMLHGGRGDFSFTPLCSNGLILRRDGTLRDTGTAAAPRSKYGENALSIGFVLSLGDFRYFTAGDFQGKVKLADGSPAEIESLLAEECPQVDVAKLNHHGHHSMPAPLVDALKARVVLAGVWNERHLTRDTARRLAQGGTPCLFAPGLMPASRRKEDAAEAWMKDVAPESFAAVHAVIDVAPDGKTYRLMMVAAKDESFRILGAYDFKTGKKQYKS